MNKNESKSSRKRNAQQNQENENRKQQRIAYKHLCDETEYIIQNGMRYVKPYFYKHETFCKQRWYNRSLFEVYSSEFGAYPPEYYRMAITNGIIRVNGKQVTCDYSLQNGDKISHTVHRHEPPVPYYPISIINSTDDMFAVNKPASIPIHACGAFRYNTLEMIIRKELHIDDFYFIHRLDRVTSGVVLIARKKGIAASLSAELQKGGCHKIYLAIVEGELTCQKITPKEGITVIDNQCIAVDKNIAIVSQKDGLMRIGDEDGKHAFTYIFPLAYSKEKNQTLVECLPITGRTHQIRLHLQYTGFPIDDDFTYNSNRSIQRQEKKEFHFTEIKMDEGIGDEEEEAKRNCQWCKMDEKEMEEVLFKEEHLHHPSIHLHALSYTIRNTIFQTELPDWEILKEVDKEAILKQIQLNKNVVLEEEKKHPHSY